jgi:hypothetical protein
MTDSVLRIHFYLLLPKYLGAVTFLSDCSQISWEQSYRFLTAPNTIGSSLRIFRFLHPKVGICHCVLGEVSFLAMTESALRIHFYLLLPIYLGAVRFLSDCSQIIWEQSDFGLTAPNLIGSSAKKFRVCHLKIGSSRNIHQNNWWLCKQVGRSQEKHETTL